MINELGNNGPVWALVGSLLVGLGFLGKWLLAFVDKQQTSHRQERDEWREANDRVIHKIEEIVIEIKDCFREERADRQRAESKSASGRSSNDASGDWPTVN